MRKQLTLVTIITEGLLREQVIEVLKRHGASGFTLTKVDGGEGSRGVRARDWEGPNLRFESIMAPAAAEAVLDEVGERFFENYAVVAWLSPVSVARGDKFVPGS